MPIRSRDAFWGNPYNRDSMNSVWRLPRSEAGNPCNRDSIKSKVFEGVGEVWSGRGNFLQKVSSSPPLIPFSPTSYD